MLLRSRPFISASSSIRQITPHASSISATPSPSIIQPSTSNFSTRTFSSSSPHRANPSDFPDHYSALSLPPTASPSEIKKSFFALSKKHHPDLSDSPDSSKFHAINDAYHTLGSAASREKYDRDYYRIYNPPRSSTSYPTGSHSSHTAHTAGAAAGNSGSYAGSRPASGLSRRRTRFRGPPPSFYAQGGYGTSGAKREANRGHTHPGSEARGEMGQGAASGMGPGQGSSVWNEEVLHFDSGRHTRTHESILNAQARMRRERGEGTIREEELLGGGSSTLFNFILITGIVAMGVGVGSALSGKSEVRKQREGKG